MRHSDVASDLLAALESENIPPFETNLSKLSFYYSAFCDINGIRPEEYRGPLQKVSKVDVRRQFISVIMHIYSPHIYKQHLEYIIPTLGLLRALSIELRSDESNTDRMVRNDVKMEKLNDDYLGKVEALTKQVYSYDNQ